MSQDIKSRKLTSQLSKKYFRYKMKRMTNYQYSSEKSVKRVRLKKNRNDDSKRDNNESNENNLDNCNNVFYNTCNDSEENDELNSDNNNINVCSHDINICEIENNEMEDDFTTSHFATWCRTLNVPITHVNVLLKDIRKHKCFKNIFPSDVRTLLGTPRSTPLKIVPPGEYYHQGLVNELVRVLSKYDIKNVDLTLNIDGLPLSKSSGKQLWPILFIIIMDTLLTIDKGLFYVIEFFDGIQIIPDNWIILNESLAYWPNIKSDKNYDAIVYTRSSIKDDWSLQPIKTILYKTESFSDAKIKLKKAEYQTDIDSPYNTDEKKKQRRDNAKIQFSDDSDNEIHEKKRKKPKKINIPSLPQAPVITMHNKTKNLSNNSSVVNIASLPSTSNEKFDILPPENEKEVNHETHQILKIVESLKISMNGLASLVREVIQRLDALEKNSESLKVQSILDEYNTLVEIFPVKTVDSFKEVESKIENNSAFKTKLITSLTQVSSADIKKTIRNILHYLISDEIAQQYSWLGQRNKTAFQNLQISKILTLVVKMRHKDITHEQISSVAAEWLKHAKQRIQRKSEKGKKYRQEKKLSSDDSEFDESN